MIVVAAAPPRPVSGLVIDPDARAVYTPEGPCPRLTPLQWRLLELLSSNPTKVFQHGEIVRHVWGDSWRSKECVRSLAHQLRKKLGPQYVVGFWGLSAYSLVLA